VRNSLVKMRILKAIFINLEGDVFCVVMMLVDLLTPPC
jgi:hypothetical protein